MDMASLPNGKTEIIGSNRDLLDVIEDLCGGDIRRLVVERFITDLTPIETAHNALDKALDVFDGKGTQYTEETIKSLAELTEKAYNAITEMI